MSGDGGRRQGATKALAALAAAVAGTYLAERSTVANWAARSDPLLDEPRALTGETRWLETPGGARLRLVESGVGPTVILAHGFTANADHWAPVASRLVDRGLRVVAFDQRGHGASTAGDGRFRAADLGDDLAAVVTSAAPRGAVVVGHSMGGMGIQAMLAGHADLAEDLGAIMLVATLSRPVSVPLGRLMGRLGGTALARRTMAHRLHGRILTRGGVGRDPNLTIIDVVRSGWVDTSDETRAAVMRDLVDFDFAETLRGVDVSTTVLCGDLDNVTPLEENRRIADLMPSARLDVLTGVGHAAPWEAADRVAEIVAAHALSDATILGDR